MSATSSYPYADHPGRRHDPYAVHHHSQGNGAAPRHAHGQRPRSPAAYTLAHAGRQVRIGPVVFWTIVGVLVIMGLWSAATATYFVFRDDLLTRLIGRQAEMQYAYEDRIADLRAQVDRLTSRQLLDQEQFEQKLGEMINRQTTLESRALALGSLTDPTVTGSIKPRAGLPADPTLSPLKPSPINDPVTLRKAPDRGAKLETGAPLRGVRKPGVGLERTLAILKESLDRVDMRQQATLGAIEHRYDSKAKLMRGVLADLGVHASKLPPPRKEPAIGGPFVPLPANGTNSFERQIYRVALARTQVEQLNQLLTVVPVRKPLPGELDQTSGFGVRLDPFIRAYAMHTGLDFRSEPGSAVRATAAGRVVTATWSGGYGKLVEIDHGNGFSTRYGHLSAIDVKEGQIVKLGQIIGRVGSTGRSTGPHLHYETRIEGEPVDPHKFLRAGTKLGAAM